MTARTLSELAELCGASLEGDGCRAIVGPATLREATESEISFLGHPRYRALVESTRAGAVLVNEEFATARTDLALLRCADPGGAFSRIVLAFAREPAREWTGVHPTALVDPGAKVGDGATIGPRCVVGFDARIGARAYLHPGVVVGPHASLGEDSVLHPGVVLYSGVAIGARCVIHAGAVIGADGFGFDMTAQGWAKIPQCGTVVVEDDVEVGANSTIDRARFGATRIGRGVKIDNQVHVGHNVQVGAESLLVAQVGIAGSTIVGKRTILAGQVGVSGHIELGDGVRVGGASAVFRDVPAGQEVVGNPAAPKTEAMRNNHRLRRLGLLVERVSRLEHRIAELEGDGS